MAEQTTNAAQAVGIDVFSLAENPDIPDFAPAGPVIASYSITNVDSGVSVPLTPPPTP